MNGNESGKKGVVFLRGKKTVLRPFSQTDREELVRGFNDPEVGQFTMRLRPTLDSEEEEWITGLSKRKDDVVLAMEAEGGILIGSIGLHGISWRDGTATTGTVIIRKDYWGRGYGSDAKMALLAYAFLELNLRKINSRVYAFNERSLAYSRKCGYVEEGRQKAQIWKQRFVNGKWDEGNYYDVVLLSVFREDWLPLWRKWQER